MQEIKNTTSNSIVIHIATPAGGCSKKPVSKKVATLIRLGKRDVFCVSSKEK